MMKFRPKMTKFDHMKDLQPNDEIPTQMTKQMIKITKL